MVTAAYAATVRVQVAILTLLQTQIKAMEEQVQARFGPPSDTAYNEGSAWQHREQHDQKTVA